jgi:hypothetical protein
MSKNLTKKGQMTLSRIKYRKNLPKTIIASIKNYKFSAKCQYNRHTVTQENKNNWAIEKKTTI